MGWNSWLSADKRVQNTQNLPKNQLSGRDHNDHLVVDLTTPKPTFKWVLISYQIVYWTFWSCFGCHGSPHSKVMSHDMFFWFITTSRWVSNFILPPFVTILHAFLDVMSGVRFARPRGRIQINTYSRAHWVVAFTQNKQWVIFAILFYQNVQMWNWADWRPVLMSPFI